MTSNLRLHGDSPPGGVPVASTQEWSGHTAQLRAALWRDQGDLQRDVMLWQRWVRYAALAILAAVTFAFGPRDILPRLPLAIVASAYVIIVGVTARLVQRSRGRIMTACLPALLLTADVLTLAALFYLSSAPPQLYRILMIGVLPVQLSVFYFGWRQGVWAAMLVLLSYLLTSLLVPPVVPGPSVAVPVVVLNATIFAVVATALIHTFGDFRARMNRLRLLCTKLGEGELTAGLPVGHERHPDDLSLLGRSFEAMRDRLAAQIGTDPLTGCLNRRALEVQLDTSWRLTKRHGTSIAVLAIDIDHFKAVNDSRGHAAGDLVLQQLAGIMQGTARDTDAVSRPGGDEFVVLLPDTGWDGAVTFAERLRARVDEYVFGPAAAPMAITVSVGVAVARATDPVSPDHLLEQADRTLYQAKSEGRNRVSA
jgi:diguanylate cyclase (GGDEF)-like protein